MWQPEREYRSSRTKDFYIYTSLTIFAIALFAANVLIMVISQQDCLKLIKNCTERSQSFQ